MFDPTSTTTRHAVTASSIAVLSRPQYRDAYERALPAARALVAGELVTINIDVPTAITTAIGKLGRITSLRDAVAKELPGFDLSLVDELETYVLALAHAHALYLSSPTSTDVPVELMSAAVSLRDALYSDAVALANRSLIAGARLAEFKAAAGYEKTAFALLGLSALLREAWPRIEGKTALTLAELDDADVIGERILAAVGAREHARVASAEVSETRRRCFTLFVRAWAQVRRAVLYLRYEEGDADEVAPSLYAGRVRKPLQRSSTPASPGALELRGRRRARSIARQSRGVANARRSRRSRRRLPPNLERTPTRAERRRVHLQEGGSAARARDFPGAAARLRQGSEDLGADDRTFEIPGGSP